MQDSIRDGAELIATDSRFIWHPCTQMKDMEQFPILPIKRAKGVFLYDFDDNKYIDCISSWWVNIFGHGNDYINYALKRQIDELEHVIFAGFTHKGIVDLSERLINLLPRNLDKCFYADNGSSAMEVALKMSFHFNQINGAQKNIFLSLENSYHGETIGALSVGDVGIYKEVYNDLLLKNIQTPLPLDSSEDSINEALDSLLNIIEVYKDSISAFVCEPLVQFAGGMNMYPKAFLIRACEICRKNGIHIIFDEIATGFGRTGEMFALDECQIVPDFLCLSKGISGGYLPLSVVITSDYIYRAFYGEYSRAFLHSHSYTGNPLAVACANASLDIFEQNDVLWNNKILSEFIFNELLELGEFDFVGNLRYKGMIFAFDLIGSFERDISLKIAALGLKEGLILRPLGKVVYFLPPYIITKEQARFVINGLKNILYNLKMEMK